MRLRADHLLAVLFILNQPVFGQITCESANFVFAVDYDDTLHIDSVFVFHSPNSKGQRVGTNSVPLNASFKALHSDSTKAQFTWFRYNKVSDKFDTIRNVKDSTLISIIPGIDEEGCYSVEINDENDSAETYTFWVFIDHLEVFAYEEDNLNCDYVTMIIDLIDVTDFKYVDIYGDKRPLTIKNDTNEFIYNWYFAENMNNILKINKTAIFDDLEEFGIDEKSIVGEVIDFFGNTQTSRYNYEIRIPKIDISPEYDDDAYAPLEVLFENNSRNADSVRWYLDEKHDSLSPNRIAVDTNYMLNDDFSYTYYTPYTFKVKYWVKNDAAGCMDSAQAEITVKGSELKVGNVFSPNGDNKNEVFKIDGKAIRYFHIVIFSRWGKKIFEYEREYGPGDDFDDDENKNWNGTEQNRGNQRLPTGPYYYIIEAVGWDGKSYSCIKRKNKDKERLSNTGTGTGTGTNQPGQSSDPSILEPKNYCGIVYLFRD
ncbi:gliding motility-associated C-terminal domain-containing protein [Bacteroidota bacterium]